jgi:hypothetical protein
MKGKTAVYKFLPAFDPIIDNTTPSDQAAVIFEFVVAP